MIVDPPSLSNTAASETPALPQRLASMDAYRGLVMLLMMAEVMQFSKVAQALPGSKFWSFLDWHQSHVDWVGCSLHDLIQPSFSFLVGVALPFSLARRTAEGQPQWHRTVHAFGRALLLVLLGVILRSNERPHTNWTFEDTLTQIGLGYGFLYIIGMRSLRVQWIALAVILVGYWLAFATHPLPGSDFDWSKAGVKSDSPNHLTGFAAHWNLNTNFAWSFDTWFMNLFPRAKEFMNNRGGYSTLNFIPTLGTMILGLLAGGVLRSNRSSWQKIQWLVCAGLIGLTGGWVLGAAGICPVVKKIWTPSWVLFSGGWCFLLLAGFYLVMDVWKRRTWAFFMMVVGMNSIAAYLISHLFVSFIKNALPRHFGNSWFTFAGKPYEPFLLGLGVLAVEWLILWWMYRKKIFIRI